MPTNFALSIENLRKSYGNQIAVDNVSLSVPSGQIYGLLGPNGAGKTTTLRCLCTLTKPDSGTITVAGVTDPRLIRQRLGYVAQEVALDKVLTGRELLEFQGGLYHIPSKEIGTRVAAMLHLLQLDEYADRQTGTYSGGLRKRLDLAAGLLHQPQVLVLDEPTVGLDIQSRLVVWQFLRDIRASGVTVLLTSHYLEEIDALADQVAIIDRGKVIAAGTPNELKNQVGGDRITLRIKEFAEITEAQQAQALLDQLPFVRSSSINPAQSNAVNLVIQPTENAIGAIQNSLNSAGLSLFSVAMARPSLDDVFLAATGQTLLDADMAAAELATVGGKKKKK
jgi:ABC-2 type transport system ATP-binding protein